MTVGLRRRGALGLAAVAAVLAMHATAPLAEAGTTGRGAPRGDARFDAITGPMKDVLIRPEDFWVDPSRTLVDVPAVLGGLDAARERAFVEALAFPRSVADTEATREAARTIVRDGLADAGFSTQELAVTNPRYDLESPDIYAELAGTQCPSKVLVIGGHYDSVRNGPGADDNASGIAAVVELAHALRDHPLPVSVRFVGFSFEETGYWGSKAMAARDRADGVDVIGAASFDMIAYTSAAKDPLTNLPSSRYLVVVSDPGSEKLPNLFAAGALRYVPEALLYGLVIDPKVLPDINRSDHASYEAEGFDGMIANDVGVVRNPNYHRPTDTVDTLDWPFLARSTRALAAGAATFGSVDQDRNGTADACEGKLVAPPTTTTTATSASTVSSPEATTTSTLPGPTAAGAVDGSPGYVG